MKNLYGATLNVTGNGMKITDIHGKRVFFKIPKKLTNVPDVTERLGFVKILKDEENIVKQFFVQ